MRYFNETTRSASLSLALRIVSEQYDNLSGFQDVEVEQHIGTDFVPETRYDTEATELRRILGISGPLILPLVSDTYGKVWVAAQVVSGKVRLYPGFSFSLSNAGRKHSFSPDRTLYGLLLPSVMLPTSISDDSKLILLD